MWVFLIFIFWSVPFFYKGKILWLSCLTLHSFTSVILVGYIIKCFFTSFSFVFYVIHFEEIWVQENLSTLTFWHCIPETSDLKTIQDILHHLVQWKFKHFFSFFVYIVYFQILFPTYSLPNFFKRKINLWFMYTCIHKRHYCLRNLFSQTHADLYVSKKYLIKTLL